MEQPFLKSGGEVRPTKGRKSVRSAFPRDVRSLHYNRFDKRAGISTPEILHYSSDRKMERSVSDSNGEQRGSTLD
jgi:hypothetical protein